MNSFLSFFNDLKITKSQYLWLIAVFTFNIILKIIYIDYSPFWYDEIISIKAAYQDFGHIKHTSEWDNNPPFYYYCLSVWIKLLGDSEYIVRLLSVLFSSLAAVYLFLIANKYFNSIAAITTSFLFLSSNIIFYYSHEARAYSLVLLLALMSTWYYFNLKNKPQLKNILLLGIINFLIIYTHYIAGLVLFFQTILMILCFEKFAKKYFSYSLLFTIALTLLRFTMKQFLLIFNFNSPKNTFWLQKSNIEYLKEVVSSFLFNDYTWLLFALVILIVLCFLMFKKTSSNFYIIYSFCLGVGSIMILFFLGKITPIFLDRYLIFSIPFLYLIISSLCVFIKHGFLIFFASFLFFSFSCYKINFKTNKNMDYRSTVAFIKKEKKETDLVIVKTKDIMPVFGYYFEKDFLKNKKTELEKSSNIISCSSWEDVSEDVTKYKRVIVIDSYENYNNLESEFVYHLSLVKKKYFVTNYFQGVKISVYQ